MEINVPIIFHRLDIIGFVNDMLNFEQLKKIYLFDNYRIMNKLYISRKLEKLLKSGIENFPITLVTGARQAGKSTMLKAFLKGYSYYLNLPSHVNNKFCQCTNIPISQNPIFQHSSIPVFQHSIIPIGEKPLTCN